MAWFLTLCFVGTMSLVGCSKNLKTCKDANLADGDFQIKAPEGKFTSPGPIQFGGCVQGDEFKGKHISWSSSVSPSKWSRTEQSRTDDDNQKNITFQLDKEAEKDGTTLANPPATVAVTGEINGKSRNVTVVQEELYVILQEYVDFGIRVPSPSDLAFYPQTGEVNNGNYNLAINDSVTQTFRNDIRAAVPDILYGGAGGAETKGHSTYRNPRRNKFARSDFEPDPHEYGKAFDCSSLTKTIEQLGDVIKGLPGVGPFTVTPEPDKNHVHVQLKRWQ